MFKLIGKEVNVIFGHKLSLSGPLGLTWVQNK